MIVYGGQFENGSFSSELLNFDLEYYDWSYISFKQNVEPFSNGACASVASVKSKSLTRLVSIHFLFIYQFISFYIVRHSSRWNLLFWRKECKRRASNKVEIS